MNQPRKSSLLPRIAVVAVLAFVASFVMPSVSQAEVVTGATAAELAEAISAEPGLITGAEFEAIPSPLAAAVSTTPLAGFPRDGDSYAVLSTGDAADIDREFEGAGPSTSFGGQSVRGNTDFDVTILRLDLDVPEGANCLLGIDFRFLTSEYPVFVGSAFNDAFIVEIGESTWTTDGSSISAPDNIAFDPLGSEISVNAAGVTSVRPQNAIGTGFAPNGATPLLRAAAPLSPGPQSLYLSIFDQGDRILDSAVQVDNLRVGTVADPATECRPGAEVAQPFAIFTADPTSGAAPLAVSVDASESFDPDGTIESYDWDFGNGETGSGVTASTVYDEPGEYEITLTVTDDEGLTDIATQTVVVGDGPPPPSGTTVSIGDQSGLERDSVTGSVFMPVTLSQPAAEDVIVSFHTVDGTALAGQDYTRWGTPQNPRTVRIPAGQLQTNINVPLRFADPDPVDKEFSVVISSVSGGDAEIGRDTGTATIVDSDAVAGADPAINVSNLRILEGADGQRRAQFQIHLSRPATSGLTVSYATADGTALAGEDYVAKLPGTVVFAPGQISRTIDVLVNSDTVAQGDREFALEVAVTAGSASELNMTGVATIIDDD